MNRVDIVTYLWKSNKRLYRILTNESAVFLTLAGKAVEKTTRSRRRLFETAAAAIMLGGSLIWIGASLVRYVDSPPLYLSASLNLLKYAAIEEYHRVDFIDESREQHIFIWPEKGVPIGEDASEAEFVESLNRILKATFPREYTTLATEDRSALLNTTFPEIHRDLLHRLKSEQIPDASVATRATAAEDLQAKALQHTGMNRYRWHGYSKTLHYLPVRDGDSGLLLYFASVSDTATRFLLLKALWLPVSVFLVSLFLVGGYNLLLHRKNEKYFQDLFENSPIANLSINPEGEVFHANRRANELCGDHMRALEGRPVNELMAKPEHARDILQRFMSGDHVHDEEVELRHPDGSTRWGSLTLRPVEDLSGQVVEAHALIVDITERKHAQTQLVHTAKLASLGTLGSGIAHEINQPLAVINTTLYMLRENLEENELDREEAKDDLRMCIRQVERMAQLTNHMRGFGKRAEQGMSEVDPRAVIENTLLLFREQLRTRKIELTVNTPEDLPTIHGNADQLEQVLINLLQNAMDALEEKNENAKITLAARALDSSRTVEISMTDNGSGIPASIQGKIFDPFFSTKEIGRGTGMGLSLSHGIVHSHAGQLLVASEAGQNTTFRIKLPVSQAVRNS